MSNIRRSCKDIVYNEIYDMVLEYICSSETVGFCNSCPELRYIEDCGCYDCPYGMDVAGCEYSPASLLEGDITRILDTIDATRP